MAISPKCDNKECGQELIKFGAILLSPPNELGKRRKYHLCKDCFKSFVKLSRKRIRLSEAMLLSPPLKNMVDVYGISDSSWSDILKKIK